MSEAVDLRWEDLLNGELKVIFGGKNAREVPVSAAIATDANALSATRGNASPWVFLDIISLAQIWDASRREARSF